MSRQFEFRENLSLDDIVDETNKANNGDVTESLLDENGDLTAEIEAIHALTTANFTTYLAKELRGSIEEKTGVYSWTHPYNKPVLTHHKSRDGEPIGRVIEADYQDHSLAGPPTNLLTVKISDEDAVEKVKDGRYDTVSIGGKAEHAYCSICGTDFIAEGMFGCEHYPGEKYEVDSGKTETCTILLGDITFVEVSFVNVPADSYAGIVDYEEADNSQNESEVINNSLLIKDGKVISENMQGGNEMDVEELEAQVNQLQESVDTKNEKIEVLETKIDNLESTNESLKKDKENLNEKVEVLETKNENLNNELDELTTENAELKEQHKEHLARRVVAKKIALEKLDEDEFEEMLEKHTERTEDSLEDTLEDLKLEQERLKEEPVEPGEEESNPGVQNANGMSNVEEVEGEEDEDDITQEEEEEWKELMYSNK